MAQELQAGAEASQLREPENSKQQAEWARALSVESTDYLSPDIVHFMLLRIAFIWDQTDAERREQAAYRHIWDFPANGSIESAPLGCRRFLHRAGLLEWHCISLCSLPLALTSQPALL